jgi:serine protease Do
MRRFFNNPLRNPDEKTMALGSGFVIDPGGYVVTNNHVVSNAQRVNVAFQDNSQHQAKVLGRDERTDIALLKVDTNQQLPYVTWGNSDDAKVGDWVVAVGNSFGLGGTVTAGIISALGRNINEGPYDDFLQIDAPINRGNSGGPTFDLHGRVIGINAAIYSPRVGRSGSGSRFPRASPRMWSTSSRSKAMSPGAGLGLRFRTSPRRSPRASASIRTTRPVRWWRRSARAALPIKPA